MQAIRISLTKGKSELAQANQVQQEKGAKKPGDLGRRHQTASGQDTKLEWTPVDALEIALILTLDLPVQESRCREQQALHAHRPRSLHSSAPWPGSWDRLK
jgi:hypothetical protein